MQMLVCTNCQPKLGFISGTLDIATPSISLYKPKSATAEFTLVGDAFRPSEYVTVSLDGSIFKTNVLVDSTGRFTSQLTMSAGESYGLHNISVAGQGLRRKPDNATGEFYIVEYIDF